MVENFHGFRGLASNGESFPVNFIFFIIRCFELLYNRESFPANNKIMQPRNFSTMNDLHYTVLATLLLLFTKCDWIWEKLSHTINSYYKTHFYHQILTLHINQQFRKVLMWNIAQVNFAVACFWGLQTSMSAWMVLNWLHLPLKSIQPTVIHHTIGDEFGHGFSNFVWCVEEKMGPMDTIWLFSSWI